MSDSFRPHRLQHVRLPCSSSPRVGSNSCPLSQWCHPTTHPLLPPSPSVLNISCIRVFSNESALHIRWPKYWSFSFSISPSNEYSGLISFRIDWFDLLAVQATLKSLPQHHSSKASILQRSAFFMVQLLPSSNNARDDSTQEHHQMIDNEIWLITFLAAKDGEALIQSA